MSIRKEILISALLHQEAYYTDQIGKMGCTGQYREVVQQHLNETRSMRQELETCAPTVAEIKLQNLGHGNF